MAKIQLGAFSTSPDKPPAGYVLLYFKTDNVLYVKGSDDIEHAIGTTNDITDLHGDVSASGPGDTEATVNSVGGKTAAQIAQAVIDTIAATDANTASTIVKRDINGDFDAGTISADIVGSLTGAASLNVLKSGDTMTGILLVTNTTQSVDKDSGAIVTEGGIGVEKNINAGGNIAAVGTVGGSNLSGTNTGDLTLLTVGSTPNSKGASISGQALTLEPADGTHPGLMTALAQVFGGVKTFLAALIVSDTTESVDKDSGSITTAGGLGVEKSINAGGDISAIGTMEAANFSGSSSGTNTGDATVTDTNTVDLSITGQDISAAVRISDATLTSDAGGLKVGVVPVAKVSGLAAVATSGAKADVGLGNVDNTSDVNKPVSTAQAAAIASGDAAVEADLSTHIADHTNPHAVTKAQVGLGNADNTSDVNKPVSTAQAAADAVVEAFSIQRANHTGTQSVSTITGLAAVATSGSKADVGLGNVDNTSDVNKPVSTAQAAADAAVEAFSIQRANHTGTQVAATISDFTEAAQDAVGAALVDTNSIHPTYDDAGNAIKADLKLSADAADAGYIKANSTVHSGTNQGLHVEMQYDLPVNIGTSNNAGTGNKVAAFDHVHAVTIAVIGGLLISTYTIGTNVAIAATDSIVGAFGKIQAQINAIVGSAITSLTGDITATGPGASASTIAVGAVTDTKASLANKPAVTVVATTNQTLTGAPTIDGQATTAGTSIALLTAQATASQNGPWVVQTGAWTRPTWYPSGGTTQSFQFITTLVRLGTVYQGSEWRQTVSGPITIDTTSTTWAVTPRAGNYRADYTMGTQSGASAVTLAFANAFKAILSWNPTANFTLTMPPTAPAAGQTLVASDSAGTLQWSNPSVNIDGGKYNSIYTPSQFISGGTP